MIPASASARVAALLVAAPDGPLPVLHRGRDAVYVSVSDRCVGVLGRHAVRVPCGLHTLVEAFDVTAAAVRDGVLELDGEPVVVGRVADVHVPRLVLASTDPAPAPDVEAMVGRGDGLTPYSDDVLCGWLAVHRAAGIATPDVDARVLAAAHRTTALSAALLECAVHGEVVPQFAAWVRALGTTAEADREADLARIGHTSGRGLLEGARLALSHLSPASLPVPAPAASLPTEEGAA